MKKTNTKLIRKALDNIINNNNMKKLIKERINVNSAAIKLAEYNYKTNELTLTFVNNREYLYKSVEPFMFEGMRNLNQLANSLTNILNL